MASSGATDVPASQELRVRNPGNSKSIADSSLSSPMINHQLLPILPPKHLAQSYSSLGPLPLTSCSQSLLLCPLATSQVNPGLTDFMIQSEAWSVREDLTHYHPASAPSARAVRSSILSNSHFVCAKEGRQRLRKTSLLCSNMIVAFQRNQIIKKHIMHIIVSKGGEVSKLESLSITITKLCFLQEF